LIKYFWYRIAILIAEVLLHPFVPVLLSLYDFGLNELRKHHTKTNPFQLVVAGLNAPFSRTNEERLTNKIKQYKDLISPIRASCASNLLF